MIMRFFILLAAQVIILCFSCTRSCYSLTDNDSVCEITIKPVSIILSDSSCNCPNNQSSDFDDLQTFVSNMENLTAHCNINDTLKIKFLCGNHNITLYNHTRVSIVSNLFSLIVQGDRSDPNCVVVHDINLWFPGAHKLQLANMTIQDVSFKVYPNHLGDLVSLQVRNCILIRSDVLIVGSHVTVNDSTIINSTSTALNLVSSNLTLTGNVNFSYNTGEKGGALRLTQGYIKFSKDARITFSHNNASDRGGAIYVDNPTEIMKAFPDSDCFYSLLNYTEDAVYNVTFIQNFATYGGSHIFGSSLKSNCAAARVDKTHNPIHSYEVICSGKVFHFEKPGFSDMPVDSAVSASPARICLCDENGAPKCVDKSKIFVSNSQYPGGLFNISLVVVGGDFGTTAGFVQAQLLHANHSLISCSQHLGGSQMDTQCSSFVNGTLCTKVGYTIYSRNSNQLLSLRALKSNSVRFPPQSTYVTELYKSNIEDGINKFKNEGVIEKYLMFTPIHINITFKSCPLGFSITQNSSRCECYTVLKRADINVQCLLQNDGGYLSHPENWIGANHEEVILSRFCPLCTGRKQSALQVNLNNTTSIDAQCGFHHTSRLCGGCKEGYSVAIGSSHCIRCSSNNQLSLLIFFAAAGVFLVIFITSTNLTVTQGMINGVIFYANIIWLNEGLIFPPDSTGTWLFLRTFIAWLNLDFGIETCFVVGLTTFWKTLLQYIFPLYIWSLVGILIVGAKYSMRLTRLLGSRTVPVLSTLILLSYMKLLRNAIVSLDFARLDYYNSEGKVCTLVVWTTDGTLNYFSAPHIFLFVAALFVLLCLCLPFTLMLLFGRYLREISYFTKFHPIFDTYFASFKDNHCYWPGLLLVVRAVLYLIKIIIRDREATITFVVLITVLLLLSFMLFIQPQRSKVVVLFHTVFLVNLIILNGSILFIYNGLFDATRHSKIFYVAVVSTSVTFVEFSIIIFFSVARNLPFSWFHSYFYKAEHQLQTHRKSYLSENVTVSYLRLRESILED